MKKALTLAALPCWASMHPRVNNIMHGRSNFSDKSPLRNLPTCVIIVKMRIEENTSISTAALIPS